MSPVTSYRLDSGPARPRRWLRAAVAVLALAGSAALALWFARDLPRRFVEARLARALDADVSLAQLEIESLHHFVLRGVEIRRVRWESRLGLSIERIDVEAPLRAALENRYTTLALDGVDVRLAPPTRPAAPPPESELRAREVAIRRGLMVATSGTEETRLEFEATLTNWGDEPTGRVSVSAGLFEPAALLGIFGEPGARGPVVRASALALRVEASLQGGPEPLRVEADAERLKLQLGERALELRGPRLEITGARDEPNDALRLKFLPSVAGIEAAALEAVLDSRTYALRSALAEFHGIEIGPLLAAGPALPDRWSVAGGVDLLVRTEDGRAFTYDLDARLARLAFPLDDGTVASEDVRATARGTWHADAGSAEVHARVLLPDGRGRLADRALPRDLFPIDVTLDGTLALAPAAFEGSTGVFSPALGRWRARGRTVAKDGRARADWRWDWSEAPDLPALLRLAALQPEIEVAGRPSAGGSLRGDLADPRVEGQLTIAGLELAGAGSWQFDRARAGAAFARAAGAGGRIGFERVEIDGRLRLAPEGAAEAWIRPLALAATGNLDVRSAGLGLEDARIEISDFAELQLRGRVEADGAVALAAQLEPVDLAQVRELAHRWFADPAPEYTLQGALSSRLELRRASSGEWDATGNVDLVAAGFSSADATRVVEGAEAHGQVSLASRPAGGIEAEATVAWIGPVVLWGTLFGDFSRLNSQLRVQARRDGAGWESSADWQLPHGVAFHGRLGSGLDYAASLDIGDLRALMDHYVRGPFEGSVEHLDTLGAAGRLHVDVAGRFDESGYGVEGMLEARDAAFNGVEGATAVEGLNLDLPISLRWSRDAAGIDSFVPGPERSGSLAYDRVRLGGLDFPALDTRLTVVGDTVRLDRPVDLALLDGRVELRQVALADWSRPARDLRFGVGLTGLSLAALTRELGTFPLQGTLNGAFPSVHVTPDRLQVDGGGTIRVFGGSVEVYGISGQDLLGRFPRLRFSARIDDVNLLDVTRTFDFGEVYGVVRGEIRDCELFGGVPVRCEASLASVETKDVAQKISVKAIRNISILGSGSHVGILDRGLQKFFDSYTYSRLGFTMKLDHDRFVLRGTERRKRSELFVKGRMPFRIDIVNAAPGQAVSFQTMMSRLRNLQVAKKPPKKKGRATAAAR